MVKIKIGNILDSTENINIDKDKFTVAEFIELTENDYGGEIIKKLKEFYY